MMAEADAMQGDVQVEVEPVDSDPVRDPIPMPYGAPPARTRLV